MTIEDQNHSEREERGLENLRSRLSANSNRGQRRFLCTTHSTRGLDFSQCSLEALTNRFADPNRLKDLPPLESLARHNDKEVNYLGNIAVWEFEREYTDKPKLVMFQSMDYKPQDAIIWGDRLIICGTGFLEIHVFEGDHDSPFRVSHPWFSGGHTVKVNQFDQLVVSCSASDAVLYFEENLTFSHAYRMPDSLYGPCYGISISDDIRDHYIHNDLQMTHLNCAFPVGEGTLVSALINGILGMFDHRGHYVELQRGFTGCHGIRRRGNRENGYYFSDSCNGELVEIDAGNRIANRFGVASCWLHDCEWIDGELFLFSLSDKNRFELWDVSSGDKIWQLDSDEFGATTQFCSMEKLRA